MPTWYLENLVSRKPKVTVHEVWYTDYKVFFCFLKAVCSGTELSVALQFDNTVFFFIAGTSVLNVVMKV